MRKAQLLAPLVGFAVALALYLLCAPALPNGDGVGYIRAARFGQLSPGHPLFVPLLRALGEPLLDHGRWLCALGGALGVALVAWRASAWAAAALAVSWVYLASAADVEVYATATLLLLVVLLVRNRLVRALAAAAAIGFHLEHVLLLPFLLAEAGVLCAGTAAILGGAAYAWAALVHEHLGLGDGIHWILTSSHGFRDPAWKAPGAALFGAAKTLAVAPYPYEAPIAMVLAQAAVGAGALVLIWRVGRGQPAPLGLSRRSLLLLAVPYAMFGLLFFPSESERWLFLLPLLWLWAAPALARTPVLSAVGLSILLAFNLLLGVRPQRDPTALLHMREARSVLREGDLVVGPGHGWDEYLDLDAPMPKDAQLYLVAYFAGKDGPETALAELRKLAPKAHRVVLVRFFEDGSVEGWKDLRLLGIDRKRIRDAVGGFKLERLAPDVYAVTRSPPRLGSLNLSRP